MKSAVGQLARQNLDDVRLLRLSGVVALLIVLWAVASKAEQRVCTEWCEVMGAELVPAGAGGPCVCRGREGAVFARTLYQTQLWRAAMAPGSGSLQLQLDLPLSPEPTWTAPRRAQP